jgi:hypothetical protein
MNHASFQFPESGADEFSLWVNYGAIEPAAQRASGGAAGLLDFAALGGADQDMGVAAFHARHGFHSAERG